MNIETWEKRTGYSLQGYTILPTAVARKRTEAGFTVLMYMESGPYARLMIAVQHPDSFDRYLENTGFICVKDSYATPAEEQCAARRYEGYVILTLEDAREKLELPSVRMSAYLDKGKDARHYVSIKNLDDLEEHAENIAFICAKYV